ncbi:MAG: sterol desaturase family protein [Myxococcales bacterium]|nr:sterol desaturase family protein [Myxococcales bacterium]
MRSPPRWTWLLFPTLTFAVAAGTAALIERGLPLPVVSTVSLASVILTVLLLERVSPLHAGWNRRPELGDIGLLLLNRGVDLALLAALVLGLERLERSGLLPSALRAWPSALPLPAQAAVGVVCGELVRYALHRASHRPGALWAWHVVHHQPERMYALNGPRLHPANQLWVSAAHGVPMLVLGAEVRAVVLTAVVTAFFVVLQHANVSLSFSGWNQVFATPDVHRLHHARRWAARGVNYGIVIVLFDRLFGTYAAAEPIGESDIGLEGEGSAAGDVASEAAAVVVK